MLDLSNPEDQHASIFTRSLVEMTRVCTAYPWTTVCLSVLLSIASIFMAQRLELRTGKLDMIPPEDPRVQDFLNFGHQFGTINRLLAVIQGTQCREAGEALASALQERSDLIRGAISHLELQDYIAQYLHTLPPEDVRTIRRQLEDNRLELSALVRTPRLATLFHRKSRRGRLQEAPEVEDLERLLVLVRFLLGEGDDPMAWVPGVTESRQGLPPFVAKDGSFLSKTREKALVVISPMTAADRDETRRPLIRAVREEIAKVEVDFGVQIQLTGEPALKEDEADAAAHSLIASSMAALSSVLVLFLFAFRRRALPLLAVLCLVASILWTLAWASIAVDYLTVVSTSFTAILIGLGVDFAIHLISRFEERRRGRSDHREVLIQAAHEVASGVLTGALTTSAAFFSMLLVGFPAFRGLGVVAGGGILLAVLETFTLLPAVIILQTRAEAAPAADETCPGESFFYWLAGTIMGSPSVGVMMALAICVVCLGPASRLGFDTNLLRMNNPEAESMKLQDLFLQDFGFSPTQNALTYDSLPNMVRGVRMLQQQAPVAFVDSLMPILPVDPEGNREDVEHIQRLLQEIGVPPDHLALDPVERSVTASRLADLVGDLRLLYLSSSNSSGAIAASRLQEELRRLALAGSSADSREREVLKALGKYLEDLKLACRSKPNTLADLSPELLDKFRSGDRYAIFVAPALDVRMDEEAQRFSRLTERVAEETQGQATGTVLLTQHMVIMLENGYVETCIYSALAVFVLLLLDLRRLDLTLIACAVCGMGILALRASMQFHGIPLNAANFIAIPLLMGVGVDNAVHIMHPWMRGAPLEEVLGCSGRPITMNAVTSTLGFGGLLFAKHQGLYSLGWAMAVGVIWCLVATFLLLPGILALYDLGRAYWVQMRGNLISHRFQ